MNFLQRRVIALSALTDSFAFASRSSHFARDVVCGRRQDKRLSALQVVDRQAKQYFFFMYRIRTIHAIAIAYLQRLCDIALLRTFTN
jgi:hypothetical protein